MNLVSRWMNEAGMTSTIDNFGNLIGVYEGFNPSLPRLVIGSHIDTQPNAGRFDGTIGVLGSIEVIQLMHEQQVIPDRSIEVVSFADEEGARYNKGLFGARGLTGNLEPGELERKDGTTRAQALKEIGLSPGNPNPPRYTPETVHAFLEMHIEQGPVLENQNLPVGIVSGISGPLWLTVEFEGRSGHAGAVPMKLRRDALVGAARVIHLFDDIVKSDLSQPTVGTVGFINNFPNSRNTISEKVTFTIDLRDLLPERRKQYEDKLNQLIYTTAEMYQLQVKVTEETNSDPKYCADWIKTLMEEELLDMRQEPFKLMSGPFHDSLIMADICPYGMIFVRCKEGISHHPSEYASIEDITIGTQLLYQTVLRVVTNQNFIVGVRRNESNI